MLHALLYWRYVLLNQKLEYNSNKFINSYQVESFIKYLKLTGYKKFMLFGVAHESKIKFKRI